MQHPKRLIETDLPIKRISAHARREKDMRLGHIPSLHIYPAARPLAACRAVVCAALWPDPMDEHCPQSFRNKAAEIITNFAKKVDASLDLLELCDKESRLKWEKLAKQKKPLDVKTVEGKYPLQQHLLDFIADFANWDCSTVPLFLETARALTAAAHEALGGMAGTKPLVVDPFAGGGSIPLEALRVGADAFASDLNPVAVLLNKVVLEYIPKHGKKLAEEVRKWGTWIKEQAEKELQQVYPKDPDGATPIAYLWARTIRCEGPNCGAEVPLVRSLWLAKKANRSVAMQMVPRNDKSGVDFQIQSPPHKQASEGTVKRGNAVCPCCHYTTPVARVREQLKAKRGGANDARLMCVVTTRPGQQGRFYRIPTPADLDAVKAAEKELEKRIKNHKGELSLVPEEPLPPQGTLGFRVQLYGMLQWGDLFSSRQLLALTTFCRYAKEYTVEANDTNFSTACNSIFAIVIDRLADLNASLCVWQINTPNTAHVFGRWALPITWDFGEVNPLAGAGGSPESAIGRLLRNIEYLSSAQNCTGQVAQCSADSHVLPNGSVEAYITDPPYYDAIPYSDILDFFYVWLKRSLNLDCFPNFEKILCPKDEECIVDEVKGKDATYYVATMQKAIEEARRILIASGIGIVVFAHKSTAGWEAQLQSMIDAGMIITGSWPIDTEMGSRLRAKASAALASSIHLVCRPRIGNPIGDWRDVVTELPQRIHAWMPRLASEGVVGADAIFACLGPALEIFSRYSRVEKANGDVVPLREYLELVWGAISKEALTMIFQGADTAGFEEDARLTSMWLWTLSAGGAHVHDTLPDGYGGGSGDGAGDGFGKGYGGGSGDGAGDGFGRGYGGGSGDGAGDEFGRGYGGENNTEPDDEESSEQTKPTKGFSLEFDAARKIAQGLGIHLEELDSVVEIKGATARLRAVEERTNYLFKKSIDRIDDAPVLSKKELKKQTEARKYKGSLLDELKDMVPEDGDSAYNGRNNDRPMAFAPGATVLDRVHQCMLLFAAGRSDALKRFLVNEEHGKDAKLWKLAQSLSALYPPGSNEKRWVDGVLARKKGLGF